MKASALELSVELPAHGVAVAAVTVTLAWSVVTPPGLFIASALIVP